MHTAENPSRKHIIDKNTAAPNAAPTPKEKTAEKETTDTTTNTKQE